MYKQSELYVIEKKRRMKGSSLVYYSKGIIGSHQMLGFDHNYDVRRGMSEVVQTILGSFTFPKDNIHRLDSNQVADLLLNLMKSKDSISQFRLFDYSSQINKMDARRNDELFEQMKLFSTRSNKNSQSIYQVMEQKLQDDGYEGLVSYYLEKYLRAGDTSDLQARYLSKLSAMNTKQAIDTMIYWLLEETPLKPEGSYVSSVFREILYPAYDSLELWKSYYSKLLPLRRYDEYSSTILGIGLQMMDSAIVDKSIFESLLSDLILSFRDDLKRKMSAKSKRYYYDEEGPKYEPKDYKDAVYGEWSNDLFKIHYSNKGLNSDSEEYDAYQGVRTFDKRAYSVSSLAKDAKLLMNFYEDSAPVRKRINRTLRIQNLSDKIDFIEVLLEGGAAIPDSMHDIYLSKMDYRYGYAALLKKNKLDRFIPKKMYKEENFVRDFSNYTRWNTSDTIVFISKRKSGIEDEKGNMYFFKHRSKKKNYQGEDPDWMYAYVWMGSNDTIRNLTPPRYFSFGNDIPKKITFNELMENEVNKLKYWKHPYWKPLIPEDEEANSYDYYGE